MHGHASASADSTQKLATFFHRCVKRRWLRDTKGYRKRPTVDCHRQQGLVVVVVVVVIVVVAVVVVAVVSLLLIINHY